MTNQEARKVLQEVWRNERNDYQSVEFREALDRAIRTLGETSSPNLGKPKGRWIPLWDNQPFSKDILYGCSECKSGGYFETDYKHINFCLNCGADMRGEEE